MILVFGAGGFIGTYLTDQLVADGQHVVATDLNEIAKGFYQRQGVPYHRLDITRRDEFDRLPTEGISAVVHLACVQPANVSEQKYDAADFIRVNVLGTLNILEFCRANRIPKIIYASSHRNTQGMWEQKDGTPIRESDGRSIKFTEIFKDGKPIKTGFQVFIENAERGLPIELWGDPTNGRDIVYVKDVVAAFQAALAKRGIGGLYNISSGRRLSLAEQAQTIIRVFSPPDRRSDIRYRPELPNLIESYFYDIGKAERTFGWRPKYSFEDMLIDYRKEMDSGRFAYLVEKRRLQMQGAQ